MAETKRVEGHWRADIQCPISSGIWKTDMEESQVRRHERYLQQTNPAGKILPTPTAVAVDGIVATGRHGGQSMPHVTAAVMLNTTLAVGQIAGGEGRLVSSTQHHQGDEPAHRLDV